MRRVTLPVLLAASVLLAACQSAPGGSDPQSLAARQQAIDERARLQAARNAGRGP
jgi:hypothetical protein